MQEQNRADRNLVMHYAPGKRHRPVVWMIVENSENVTDRGTEPREYYPCNLFVMAEGQVAAGSKVGELYVDYDIEFSDRYVPPEGFSNTLGIQKVQYASPARTMDTGGIVDMSCTMTKLSGDGDITVSDSLGSGSGGSFAKAYYGTSTITVFPSGGVSVVPKGTQIQVMCVGDFSSTTTTTTAYSVAKVDTLVYERLLQNSLSGATKAGFTKTSWATTFPDLNDTIISNMNGWYEHTAVTAGSPANLASAPTLSVTTTTWRTRSMLRWTADDDVSVPIGGLEFEISAAVRTHTGGNGGVITEPTMWCNWTHDVSVSSGSNDTIFEAQSEKDAKSMETLVKLAQLESKLKEDGPYECDGEEDILSVKETYDMDLKVERKNPSLIGFNALNDVEIVEKKERKEKVVIGKVNALAIKYTPDDTDLPLSSNTSQVKETGGRQTVVSKDKFVLVKK